MMHHDSTVPCTAICIACTAAAEHTMMPWPPRLHIGPSMLTSWQQGAPTPQPCCRAAWLTALQSALHHALEHCCCLAAASRALHAAPLQAERSRTSKGRLPPSFWSALTSTAQKRAAATSFLVSRGRKHHWNGYKHAHTDFSGFTGFSGYAAECMITYDYRAFPETARGTSEWYGQAQRLGSMRGGSVRRD